MNSKQNPFEKSIEGGAANNAKTFRCYSTRALKKEQTCSKDSVGCLNKKEEKRLLFKNPSEVQLLDVGRSHFAFEQLFPEVNNTLL